MFGDCRGDVLVAVVVGCGGYMSLYLTLVVVVINIVGVDVLLLILLFTRRKLFIDVLLIHRHLQQFYHRRFITNNNRVTLYINPTPLTNHMMPHPQQLLQPYQLTHIPQLVIRKVEILQFSKILDLIRNEVNQITL